LIRLLQNHSIEAYALEKGTVLDSPARKLIDIVDSMDQPFKGVRELWRLSGSGIDIRKT